MVVFERKFRIQIERRSQYYCSICGESKEQRVKFSDIYCEESLSICGKCLEYGIQLLTDEKDKKV